MSFLKMLSPGLMLADALTKDKKRDPLPVTPFSRARSAGGGAMAAPAMASPGAQALLGGAGSYTPPLSMPGKL